jgi:hypothetical protein
MNEPMSFHDFLRELSNEREAPGLPEGVKLVEKVQHVVSEQHALATRLQYALIARIGDEAE